MIVFSEIGDKTFLIAAILAMRHSRLIVFGGAFASLVVMSVLSSFLGAAFPSLLPKSLTTFLASLLFFVFGAKMWKEGKEMSGEEMGEEWEEAKREIEEEEEEHHELEDRQQQSLEEGTTYPRINLYPAATAPNGNGRPAKRRDSINGKAAAASTSFVSSLKEGTRNLCGLCFSPVFAQAFVLTFLGEWGDRSQIATIALAAAHNITLVALGTVVGHSLCTALAVLGGSWLASRISPKHITLGGAALFLLFGFVYLFESWEEYTAQAAVTASSGGVAAVTGAAQAVADGVAGQADKMAAAMPLR
ncbi:UPF0016-domain-containing protein [Jaminaea rosea]|uniref:GDT1 family protein n=1 Tax=Jaminaea rosea TaxID=1569628 RepID=A0A316UPE8_9BASI|nr:UPF0016-domain-containing protein [Jaminaea rosea]PWN25753.1 UPF0016-domain-containing protein [Jaminaea rosea]